MRVLARLTQQISAGDSTTAEPTRPVAVPRRRASNLTFHRRGDIAPFSLGTPPVRGLGAGAPAKLLYQVQQLDYFRAQLLNFIVV